MYLAWELSFKKFVPVTLDLGNLTCPVTCAESGAHLFAIFGLNRLQLLHKLFDLSSDFISPAHKLSQWKGCRETRCGCDTEGSGAAG